MRRVLAVVLASVFLSGCGGGSDEQEPAKAKPTGAVDKRLVAVAQEVLRGDLATNGFGGPTSPSTVRVGSCTDSPTADLECEVAITSPNGDGTDLICDVVGLYSGGYATGYRYVGQRGTAFQGDGETQCQARVSTLN